jgi:hypothetical protein
VPIEASTGAVVSNYLALFAVLRHSGKRPLKLVTSATVLRTVALRRSPNRDLRTREHLAEAEVERLVKTTKGNRYGLRDAVLVAYRHGLWAAELTHLSGEQVDFRTATLHLGRVKQGTPSIHPILGTNHAPSGGSSGSRRRNRRSCSPPSGARRLPPQGSPE